MRHSSIRKGNITREIRAPNLSDLESDALPLRHSPLVAGLRMMAANDGCFSCLHACAVLPLRVSCSISVCSISVISWPLLWSSHQPSAGRKSHMVPRGLEPRTLRLLAVRSNHSPPQARIFFSQDTWQHAHSYSCKDVRMCHKLALQSDNFTGQTLQAEHKKEESDYTHTYTGPIFHP